MKEVCTTRLAVLLGRDAWLLISWKDISYIKREKSEQQITHDAISA